MDGAVIRDVMIFNSASKPMPDETNDTTWNLTARVYFDVASEMENGTLTFARVNSTEKIQIPVQFSTNALDEPQDLTLVVPVRFFRK